jgi:hypothetical protein
VGISLVDVNEYLKVIENPEVLGKGGEKYWKEIEFIISELLDELEANGKIKHVFVPIEMEHMSHVINNIYQLGINSNWVLHLLYPPENFKSFLAVSSKFGFDETKAVNLFIQTSVLSCVLHTELFKTLLLFHLTKINHRTSQFPNTMEKAAPKSWKKLKPHVDSNFRNSLAHGTWAIENNQVVLFEDAELVPYERLNFDKFLIKAKKQNILYSCLAGIIIQRFKAGFFAPLPMRLSK